MSETTVSAIIAGALVGLLAVPYYALAIRYGWTKLHHQRVQQILAAKSVEDVQRFRRLGKP